LAKPASWSCPITAAAVWFGSVQLTVPSLAMVTERALDGIVICGSTVLPSR